MKKILLALAIGLIAMGCRDREPNPNVLPPATQEGKNTAGCLVDGKVLVFSNNIGNQGYERSEYGEPGNGFSLKLYMTQIRKRDMGFSLIMRSNKELELNKKYIIGNNYTQNDVDFPADNLFIVYNDVGYMTDDNHKAEIVFTKLKTQFKGFVSGTFSGKLISPETGKVITITEGRFDKDFNLN